MNAMSLLLNSTIKMSVVLLIALGVTALLRRRSAALRHWVLATAIACAAVMPLLEMMVPSWSVSVSAPQSLQPAADAVQPTARSNQAPPSTGGGSGNATAQTGPSISTPIEWSVLGELLRPLWLSGVAISLAILLIGLGRLRWLASGSRRVTEGRWNELAGEISHAYGIQRRFVLLQSDHPSLLVTWGVALPKVLLPAAASDWSSDRARVVLCHELAHIRRGDWMVQIAAELLRAFYWFNPLLWIVSRRLRLESEHACDDEVMSRGVEGTDYATHLVDLARALHQRRYTWLPAPAMARPSSLERRVRAMLNNRVNRNPTSGSSRAAIVVLLLIVAAAAAMAQNMFQSFSGTVVDATSMPIPGVRLVMANLARDSKYEVKTDATGKFEFVGLLSGDYVLEAAYIGFMRHKEDVRLTGRDQQRQLVLQIGQLEETITVAISERETSTPVVKEVPMPDVLSGCRTIPVGGNIRAPKKVRDLAPQYPAHLRGSGTEGTVVLNGRIGLDGYINNIQTVGDAQPDLVNAAIEAVREWRFTQTMLNCTPVEVPLNMTIRFRAMPPPPPPAPPRP
jgi:beta-lactamase regulating signal transducer with metallopeptidase domain